MARARALSVAVASAAVIGLTGCNPEQVHQDLESTYNARQCIIDRESRSSGLYDAEYGNHPGGADGSTASGAYQWLNSSWQKFLPWAEEYYGMTLTSEAEDQNGAREHAAYASPYAQDVVATYALIVRPQNQRPWTYQKCWDLVGSPPELREDGPVNQPPGHVLEQIEQYVTERTVY
jgi:hypothetical protein